MSELALYSLLELQPHLPSIALVVRLAGLQSVWLLAFGFPSSQLLLLRCLSLAPKPSTFTPNWWRYFYDLLGETYLG